MKTALENNEKILCYQYERTEIYVLRLKGNITDKETTQKLEKTVSDILKEKISKLIIYQKEETFAGEEELGQVLRLLTNNNTNIKFAGLSGRFKELVMIRKLNTQFKMYDSLEEAVKSYN